MPQDNKQNPIEKKLADMQQKSEYPVVNRSTLKDYDALRVKRWVEEHEL